MAAATETPLRLTGPQRREQILDVTKAIVGEKGFHAISIDGVAKRAGITRPVVYGHFDDLSGLLGALVEREGTRAVEQLMATLPRPSSDLEPQELLLGSLRGFLEAVGSDPVTWRLVLMPEEGTPPVLREQYVLVRRGVTELLAELAPQTLTASGMDAPADPELTALALQAVSEEFARLLLEDPKQFPVDRLVAQARWMLGLIGPR